jgi:hypothetical protein
LKSFILFSTFHAQPKIENFGCDKQTSYKGETLKENALNNTVRCYDRENTRKTDNIAAIKEDTRLSRSLQQIGEDKLYV